MTDGCNMGVKSLSRYLNQYQAVDEPSKEIAKRLIALEERLAVNVRSYVYDTAKRREKPSEFYDSDGFFVSFAG